MRITEERADVAGRCEKTTNALALGENANGIGVAGRYRELSLFIPRPHFPVAAPAGHDREVPDRVIECDRRARDFDRKEVAYEVTLDRSEHVLATGRLQRAKHVLGDSHA